MGATVQWKEVYIFDKSVHISIIYDQGEWTIIAANDYIFQLCVQKHQFL
jgi:hypothetical protein